MVHIKKFKKSYPGNEAPVLLINDFEIAKGIYWVKGTNGSGKTSLFKSIAGILPFEGAISVNGMDLNHHRMQYASAVNYAEAEPKYPAFLSGKELIDFYKATKKGHFPEALFTDLGVDEFMDQKTGTYSSGMIKKLSLVLAFTGNAQLVLLDEPLVALDINAVDVLQSAIRQYAHTGVTFLITSHQPLNDALTGPVINLLVKDKTLQPESI
jgi:ABC-2 type transport system ATP-binding protein